MTCGSKVENSRQEDIEYKPKKCGIERSQMRESNQMLVSGADAGGSYQMMGRGECTKNFKNNLLL